MLVDENASPTIRLKNKMRFIVPPCPRLNSGECINFAGLSCQWFSRICDLRLRDLYAGRQFVLRHGSAGRKPAPSSDILLTPCEISQPHGPPESPWKPR